MQTLYKYRVMREDRNGNRGKRAKTYYSYEPSLEIGRLYTCLGIGFPGAYRVPGLTTKEFSDCQVPAAGHGLAAGGR